MRTLRRALLASGLGFATSFIAACGGGGAGLLSGDQANTLQNQLSHVSSALAERNCRAARAAADRLVQQVASLPATITTPLLQDLDLGASTIKQLAATQCHPPIHPTAPQTTPTTTSTTTGTTTPTTTTQTSTTTTTTSTTPATTPTTTGTTTGPSGGGGLGGGAGGVQQSGGSGAGSNVGGKGNG